MDTTFDLKPILAAIYGYYENWTLSFQLACHSGCAACCTRNVNIIRAEGEMILSGLEEKNCLKKLSRLLPLKGNIGRQHITTNGWAEHCLKGMEIVAEDNQVMEPCPFLDGQNHCSIYRLRPFSCRCFGSTVDCRTSGVAEQPDILMEVNTVTLQLIEHLGQGQWWGNMLDMLPALLAEQYEKTTSSANPEEINSHLLNALPVPGFLIMPEQQAAVQQYLEGLFALSVGETSLDKILNRP